jgi:hypothetical protein
MPRQATAGLIAVGDPNVAHPSDGAAAHAADAPSMAQTISRGQITARKGDLLETPARLARGATTLAASRVSITGRPIT